MKILHIPPKRSINVFLKVLIIFLIGCTSSQTYIKVPCGTETICVLNPNAIQKLYPDVIKSSKIESTSDLSIKELVKIKNNVIINTAPTLTREVLNQSNIQYEQRIKAALLTAIIYPCDYKENTSYIRTVMTSIISEIPANNNSVSGVIKKFSTFKEILSSLPVDPPSESVNTLENLWSSCVNGQVSMVTSLLKSVVDINTPDIKHNSQTALHYAVMGYKNAPDNKKDDFLEICRMLITYGADPYIKNGTEDTPLSLAKLYMLCDVLKIIGKDCPK